MKESPLITACRFGRENIVKQLLERGVDSKAKDFLGRSCQEIAALHKHNKLVHVLNLWNLYNTKNK